jgi:hypothetical protein
MNGSRWHAIATDRHAGPRLRKEGSTRAGRLSAPSRSSKQIEEVWQVWNKRRKAEADLANPVRRLHRRMSARLRQSLGSADKAEPTFALLGYTKPQLIKHLERQFLPDMGWHNFRRWHIDHIIPLAAFKCQSYDDADFKAAWALNNLRPIWPVDNLRKGDRRELLL